MIPFASLTRQSSSTTPIIHAIRRKSTSDMNIESTRAYTRRASLKWNKAALSADAKSILGTKGKISGLNLFQRLNFWVVKLGGSILTSRSLSPARGPVPQPRFVPKTQPPPSR